jgi:NADH:ubiquinone oxidoreductase subunit E
MKNLSICMGSSCFSRGNSENVDRIGEYITAHGLGSEVFVSGCLCGNRCKNGPIIMIDGAVIPGVTPEKLSGVLDDKLGES